MQFFGIHNVATLSNRLLYRKYGMVIRVRQKSFVDTNLFQSVSLFSIFVTFCPVARLIILVDVKNGIHI